MKRNNLDLLAIVVLFVVTLAIAAGFHWSVDKLITLALPKEEVNVVHRLEAIIDELPPGNLKSNMYTVLAAEYGGDGDSLQERLKAYAEMRIKELQERDSL
jgi:hypothetical protein